MLRRTPFKRTAYVAPPPAPPTPATRRATYAATATAPLPKPATYRDPALLEMARGKPCMFLVPACCSFRIDTTVAAHENEGKGMAIKASDARSVWACMACHTWYDTGPAPREQKRAAFAEAIGRQALAWEQVANDPGERPRFREAARRALDQLHEG